MQVVFPDDWNGAFKAAPEIARPGQRAAANIFRVRLDNPLDAVRDADIAVALREDLVDGALKTRFDAFVYSSIR
jgi:hypothetical protein